jgi:hypothetical protein
VPEAGGLRIAGLRSCALAVAADQSFLEQRAEQGSDLLLELLLRDLELGKKPLDNLRFGGCVLEQLPEPCPCAVQLENSVGTQVYEHSPVVQATRNDIRSLPESVPLSVLGRPRHSHGATI